MAKLHVAELLVGVRKTGMVPKWKVKKFKNVFVILDKSLLNCDTVHARLSELVGTTKKRSDN